MEDMFVQDLVQDAMEKILLAKRESDAQQQQKILCEALDLLQESCCLLASMDGIEAQRKSNVVVFPRKKKNDPE